jgi:hypothetical protein
MVYISVPRLNLAPLPLPKQETTAVVSASERTFISPFILFVEVIVSVNAYTFELSHPSTVILRL